MDTANGSLSKSGAYHDKSEQPQRGPRSGGLASATHVELDAGCYLHDDEVPQGLCPVRVVLLLVFETDRG